MEALQTAITTTCPLAFTGASGALFVNAVTALVAAHCAIVDDYGWPKDEAEKIMRAEENPEFDFIIIGAGTAGSILAGRLSSYFPKMSFLLIEAGEDPGLDSEIPALLFLNQNTHLDWNYKTHAEGKNCLGFHNNSCIWSKGRALGGSSSINAMLFIRGHPENYNKWSENGNPGWSYKDLSSYFEKIEKTLQISDYKHMENPWYDTIRKAWTEVGLMDNGNSKETKIGTQITKLLTKDGKRLNTAKIYLSERANLHIMKTTTVQRVILDSTARIVRGVEIRHASGKIMNIYVNKEVIMSAGSIATPQILMLSGIGPKQHLEDNNIKCLEDLPVGKNLQDHLLLPIFLKTNLRNYISPQVLNSFLLQYMMDRSGPFTNIGITDFMGFIDTKNTGYPDIQFHHTYFTINDTFMLKPYLKGVGYKEEIIKAIEEINKESDILGIYPTLLHPKSRGEILLNHPNQKSKPVIISNYFQDPEDLKVLVKGIAFILNLTDSDTFKVLGVKVATLNIPGCSTFSFHSEKYWECYIKHMATTIYHPVGTVKMGLRTKGGVVNEQLMVHGIRNARVVDASIMPTITSGNTMAPTMVIAEKAADIIKEYYRVKEEL